ncbi:hypothetical protein Glo7428_0905 [Gloeocapsa sp. PCC 7428]|uniref:hypothetical protein n=1 Tax=Gloeocapsa sp. PCC 7428 TaxID=1173026 RepID=UPI0002A5E92D|nr:hypothetical protein [Gloeocapsa sp. PCC 7428]AFZ29484.1 hypothetical protein Glo7428_0905 [Gloeocapsa sp. PCC 7428]
MLFINKNCYYQVVVDLNCKASGEEDNMSINIKEQLLKEIEKASDSTLKKVLDFLLFIQFRELQQEQLEISLLSESILAEDWLTPEEDEAWQHL